MSSNQLLNTSDGIELKRILPHAQPVGVKDLNFKSACGKWDECQPGDLFVAVETDESDGHNDAVKAVEKGAIAVVAERLLPITIPQFVVDDSRIAYGHICQALAGSPTERISAIGIGGTAGKTVTAHLLDNVFRVANKTVGLSSSIETRFGDTTNDRSEKNSPPSIANNLSKMVFSNCSHAIVEASSIELAKRSWSGISLDSAVITNSSSANVSYHGNRENYLVALTRMLDLVSQTGFAVFNADDKDSEKLIELTDAPSLSFGIHHRAQINGKLLERNNCFQTFLINAGSETAVVRTETIGKQHIYNCLAATAVALTYGIDLDVIVKGLETVRIPGRLERVDCGQKFGVWIDSSLSPQHLNCAIAALGPVCEGNLWCICSTDPSQSREERNQLGSILERKTEKAILTQNAPSDEIDYEPCHQILDGFDNPKSAQIMPNRIKAIEWVLSNAQPNDSILISGAGEKPICYSDEKWAITDRDICSTCLYDLANGSTESGADQNIFRIEDYR